MELGIQAVISPFQHNDPSLQTFFNGGYYGYVSTRFDIPLSTAVGLSARFTAIGPPGYHVDDPAYPLWAGKTSPRFVDGGYVENSGVETATAFWQLLLRSVNYRFSGPNPGPPILTVKSHLDFKLNDDFSDPGADNPPPEGLRGIRLNELSSPIEALLNARAERARTAISNAEYTFPSHRAGIPFKFFKPPLRLAHFTIHSIKDQRIYRDGRTLQ